MNKNKAKDNAAEGELFESEWAILEVVWEHEHISAPDVTERLSASKDWAYTTVKTLMDRMVKKGLLKVEKVRNLHLYCSAIAREEAQKTEVLRTVKRAFNGMLTPMMQFLIETEDMTAADFDELERLIKSRRDA
ncbi:MAG: BlaI/MecI/CopY family transcriptional regulator [Sedimentisphaerales bacterium]|nr:BlaI/MecI/CopY family transcriptional regulator [Sedimentisphaerales bacterium]